MCMPLRELSMEDFWLSCHLQRSNAVENSFCCQVNISKVPRAFSFEMRILVSYDSGQFESLTFFTIIQIELWCINV